MLGTGGGGGIRTEAFLTIDTEPLGVSSHNLSHSLNALGLPAERKSLGLGSFSWIVGELLERISVIQSTQKA